jgi:hypothetical protein
MIKRSLWRSLFALGTALVLAACIPQGTVKEEPTPEWTTTPTAPAPGLEMAPTPTPTPTLGGGGSLPTPTPGESRPSSCPEVDIVYQLDYVHQVVQHMSSAHVEHVAEPDAAFYFTVREDGTADSNDFETIVHVSITGELDDCVLEGKGELSAEINGRCAGGVASLHIAEHWESVSTTVTCPGKEPQSTNIAGFFSAPEDRFDLQLDEDGATHILEADTPFLSVYYSWTLYEYGLGIVPLVPPD